MWIHLFQPCLIGLLLPQLSFALCHDRCANKQLQVCSDFFLPPAPWRNFERTGGHKRSLSDSPRQKQDCTSCGGSSVEKFLLRSRHLIVPSTPARCLPFGNWSLTNILPPGNSASHLWFTIHLHDEHYSHCLIHLRAEMNTKQNLI